MRAGEGERGYWGCREGGAVGVASGQHVSRLQPANAFLRRETVGSRSRSFPFSSPNRRTSHERRDMADMERIRLVVLGGAGVGKSAIIRRLLGQGFSERYRPTVEDLYTRECALGTLTLKVDLLDTAGKIGDRQLL